MTHRKDTPSPKAHLKLHRIGRKYMLVESPDDCLNLTNVYSLNDTAAWLWTRICGEAGESLSPEQLALDMCRAYDVEYQRALSDVERQLEDWKQMGLI